MRLISNARSITSVRHLFALRYYECLIIVSALMRLSILCHIINIGVIAMSLVIHTLLIYISLHLGLVHDYSTCFPCVDLLLQRCIL